TWSTPFWLFLRAGKTIQKQNSNNCSGSSCSICTKLTNIHGTGKWLRTPSLRNSVSASEERHSTWLECTQTAPESRDRLHIQPLLLIYTCSSKSFGKRNDTKR